MDAGGWASASDFLSPLPPALIDKPTTQRPDTRPDERNEKQQETKRQAKRQDETTRQERQEKTPQAKRQAALQENRPRKPRPTPISITLPTRTSGATNGANNKKTIARTRAFRTIRASYLVNIMLGILLPHIASLPSQTPQLINKPRPT